MFAFLEKIFAPVEQLKTFEPVENDNITLEEYLSLHGICTEFNDTLNNLIIMDDREEIVESLIDEMFLLSKQDRLFNIESLNILKFSGKMAGFNVVELLNRFKDIEIEFALLDIVLGGKKMVGDKRLMLDGVDVALKIFETSPDCKILFFSGCFDESVNEQPFGIKFFKNTGNNIYEYSMPKDVSIFEEKERLKEFFNWF